MQKRKKQVFINCVICLLVLAVVLVGLTHKPKLEAARSEDTEKEVYMGFAEIPKPTSVLTSGPEPDIAPEYQSLGMFKLSAYCPCVKCCGIWSTEHPSRAGTDFVQKTKSGTIPTAGRTIGVDPEVIPLGTTVYIDGHEYVTEDTGSSVNGKHIDVFFETHEEACVFGIKEAEVFILAPQ